MKKILKILIIALIAAAGLHISAVNFLPRSAASIEPQNNGDVTAQQAVLYQMPFLP